MKKELLTNIHSKDETKLLDPLKICRKKFLIDDTCGNGIPTL